MGSFIRFIIFSVVVGVLAVILVNYTSSELSPQAIEYNSKLSAVKENKNYIKANTLFKTLSLPVQTDNISTFVFQKYTLALDRKLLQILKANSKIIKSMDEIVFLGAIQDPIVEIGVETRVQSISERLRTRKLENSVFDLYLAYLRRFLARGANKAAVLAKLIRYEDFLTRSLYKLGHHEKKLSMLQSLRSVRKIIYSMDEKKEFRILDFDKIAEAIILSKLIVLRRELPSIQKKLTFVFAPLADTNRSINLFIEKSIRAKGKSCSRASDCAAETSDKLISYIYNPVGRYFIRDYTPKAYILGMHKDSIERMNSRLPSDPAY